MPRKAISFGIRVKWLSVALKASLSVGLLVWLFLNVDLVALLSSVRELDWGWFLVGFLFLGTVSLMHVVRWRLLLRAEQTDVPFGSLLACYTVGNFFGQFLPRIVGGDAVRALYVSRFGISKTRSMMILVLARFFGVVALLGILAVCVAYSPDLMSQLSISRPLVLGWSIGILALMVSGFLVVSRLRPERLGALTNVIEALRLYGTRWGTIGRAFFISVVLQLLVLARYYAVSEALDLDLGFFTVSVISVLVMGLTMIPITLNGIGLRENGFVFFLSMVGVPREAAVAFSLTNYALMLLMAIAGGAVYVSGFKYVPQEKPATSPAADLSKERDLKEEAVSL